MTKNSRSGPVFVVGVWRSGTSLFYALLNQHPQIALMYEGELPLLWPLFLGRKRKPDWLQRWNFWNSALTRHHIEVSSIPNDVSDLRSATEAVWRQYAGLAIGGCKSPNFFDCLGRLAHEFPDARFIVIWRDLTDICRSIIEAGRKDSFFSKCGILSRALLGYRKLKLGCDELLSRGLPVHQVQYEELVRDPGNVMSCVCKFLQIPFDPRMKSLDGAERSAIYEAEHHRGVKGEKITATKEKPEVLSPRLRRKIERYVGFWQKEYGGTWPLYPKLDDPDRGQPGVVERLVDEMSYFCLRRLDRFVVFVYCFAPIWLLEKYRSAKGRTRPIVQTKQEERTLDLASNG